MSFKPGDRVEGVGFVQSTGLNGKFGVVVGFEYESILGLTAVEVQWDHGHRHGATVRRLRKIDPPLPDEFQPAEPEFVSDLLKRLNKVKV